MERAIWRIGVLVAMLLIPAVAVSGIVDWTQAPDTRDAPLLPSFQINVASALGSQTVDFNDLPGTDGPLNGQYPTGVIDWGDGQWSHTGPSGAFTTNSLLFAFSWQTNVTFTFLAPRRLTSLNAYNAGTQDTTVTVSCARQPNKLMVVPAGQVRPIETGWTDTCTRVTLRSNNGQATRFDDLVFDDTGTVLATSTPSTPGATNTVTPTRTSTLTPTVTPTRTPTRTPGAGPTPGEGPLLNGGWEQGLAGWVRPSWFASVADVQSEVHNSGSNAFYFHGRTNGSYVYQDVPATGGQIVTLDGWVNATYKNSGPDWHHYGHAHIKLMCFNASDGKIHTFPGYDGMPIPPGGWQEVSFTQQLPPDTAYVRLQFDTYGLDGVVYLDDFSLTFSAP